MYALSRAQEVSFDWLITGEEQITPDAVNDESAPYNQSEIKQIYPYKHKVSQEKDKPGNGYNMSHLFFPKEWFSTRHLNRENLVAINVIGDSLEPDIPDGSLILVDTSQKELKNGEVYVFNIDDDLLIKTIIHDFDGYIARSKNATYPDIRLEKERVSTLNIVGRAVRALPDIKL